MSRLKDNILKIGKIGEISSDNEPRGISRLRNSREYYEAIDKMCELLKNENIDTKVDPVGNLHVYLKGRCPNLKTIVIGSHMDTVLNGGLFDGHLGVMAGIECILRLKETNTELNHNIEILGFNFEESSELGGTFGSRAMMGMVDTTEEKIEKNLSIYNLDKKDVELTRVDTKNYKSYLELHIEQGGWLEAKEKEIGIVTGIIGVTRYRIVANGESNHAGTTMMECRKDALVSMSKLIVEIDRLAREYGDSFVATVGKIKVYPSAENVIPGKCEIILELRHMNSCMYTNFIKDIESYTNNIEECKFSFEKLIEKGSVTCDDTVMKNIEKACEKENVSYIRMPSGAGHDANPMAHYMPVGMIFVPSEGGISHSPFEWTSWEDVERGGNVLYSTLLMLDQDIDS